MCIRDSSQGKRDLFAVVIALRYLTGNDEFKALRKDLSKLISKVLKECPHISRENLLGQMGFPAKMCIRDSLDSGSCGRCLGLHPMDEK